MNNINNYINNVPRRPVRLNLMRRLHEGLSPIEINQTETGASLLTQLLQLTIALLPFGVLKNMIFGMATVLYASIQTMREIAYKRLDPIDAISKEINS